MLRAYCKYLRQAGIAFSQAYMEDTLATQPAIARAAGRAVPRPLRSGAGERRGAREAAVRQAIEHALDNGREPRRGPHPAALPQPHPRHAAHQLLPARRGRRAQALPLVQARQPRGRRTAAPRPLVEIFVYSPRVEGDASARRQGRARRHPLVRPARGFPHRGPRPDEGADGQERRHRAGRLEGRLRASSSRPPAGGRDALQAEGVDCYKTLIRGLLDLTDNHRGRQDRAAAGRVVRHDGDDPYLVVAADKGTATFSDIANAISAEYGFWLGDAFASGGSAGYDHKEMGITARGAWESVKRHFRELGRDIQSQDFTVRRRRRHVGRRVRQRHAAVAAHPAARRLRPPPHLRRSRLPIRRRASPSASACSTCRARPGRTTTRR